MSDDTIVETVTEQTDDVATVEAPQGDPAESTDWKAEARKWEKRAKEANADRELAAKWREYEASLKPEQERLAEDLVTAKQEADSARTALLRYEVAAEKNIPTEAIRLLNGSTREDLEEAADALIALMAIQSKPRTPVPDESQGRPATQKLGQLTEADLANMTPAEVNEARRTGRLVDLLAK
jgi:hypothetical protein